MKIIYLILAIILWCSIPILGLFSLLGLIFLLLGLVFLLKGREIKY